MAWETPDTPREFAERLAADLDEGIEREGSKAFLSGGLGAVLYSSAWQDAFAGMDSEYKAAVLALLPDLSPYGQEAGEELADR